MAYKLKDIYSPDFFQTFIELLQSVLVDLDKSKFLSLVIDEHWDGRELKDRMRHLTIVLHQFMPTDFVKASQIILQLVKILQKSEHKDQALAYMFLPDYIEKYGLDNFTQTMKTMEIVTQFTSCEFAIRPFIIKYPTQTIKQLISWSTHQNLHVRRLASEGCRPRLPWAMALPSLKKDPAPILPILEKLKNDDSLYVRRSVANNLNDISKDNPTIVLQLAQQWIGKNKETDWVVKHACRTLLKQGNQTALTLFGYGALTDVTIENFQVLTPIVKVGDYLKFSFQLVNKQAAAVKIRLEYGLYYKKANGSLSKKVFKISEKSYPKNSTTLVVKRQSFKIITTRKFYAGIHKVAIIMNGKEFDSVDFELIM